jgi:glyoxylase-like metal-dependent hydrolase (beta-lactamase superfamily II)
MAQVLLGAVALVLAPSSELLAQTAPATNVEREIVPLTKDLYRVRAGTQHTIFFVTSEGIVVGDPLSTTTAAWLKKELDTRFPGRPIRFVLHTHHHFDRAEGAAELQPRERVAHLAFNEELSQSRRRLPAFVDSVDRNGDGAFGAGELAGTVAEPLMLGKDRDGDGRVT